MGKEQEVESLSIRMSIDTAGVIAGLTAVNNLFTKITANAYSTTAEINRMLAALGQLSGVEHGGIGVGRPGEYSPRNPTQPNDPPGSPAPDIPKPTSEPTQPTPTTGQPTQPTVLPRRTTGQRLDYTTRRWVNRIKRLVMPLIAAFGARALWKGFNDGVKMIDTYRKQIGMNTSELDKWAKANQYAGGSQKALLDTMAKFVKETGQSADDFIEMMLHFNELSEAEQEQFLKTKGYSEEAVAIFKKSDADIVNILSVTKDMAFTDNDIKTVKGFNEQWQRFKVISQGIGNILIRYIQPALTAILRLLNDVGDWAVKHQGTLKTIATLIAMAFGGAFVRQLKAGTGAGGMFVKVLKALTSGVFGFGKALNSVFAAIFGAIFVKRFKFAAISGGALVTVLKNLAKGVWTFSKALLKSPITKVVGALGFLYLILEDIVGFVQGKNSFIGNMLEKWFGKDVAEMVKESLTEVVEAVSDLWLFIKFIFGSMTGKLNGWGISWKNIGKLIATVVRWIIFIFSLGVATILKILSVLGKAIGKSIGYLVVNIPKWWETIVNAVKGWWEALKDGAEQIWEDIKNVISSAVNAVIQLFVGLWESACKYVDKSINKLKELNPFQEFAEDLGSGAYDITEKVKGWFGFGAPSVTGAHKLPVTAGNKNVSITQNNNYNIKANDSVEAAEKGLKQAEKDLAQTSFMGVTN